METVSTSPVNVRPFQDLSNNPCVMSINKLYNGNVILRRPPAKFYTNYGLSTTQSICQNVSLGETDIIFATFDRRASVRGSAVIKFDDGTAFFPRCASEIMTEAFLEYNKSIYSEANPDLNFYSYFDFCNMTTVTRKRVPIEGDVIWVTPDEPFNWGMWLIQTLTALSLCEKYQIDADVLCYAGSEWQKKFLDFFAPSYRGRIIQQNLELEYFSTSGLRTFVRTQRNMVLGELDAGIFDFIAQKFSSTSTIKKIFLSRIHQANIQPNHRLLINEHEICRLMQGLGYTVVFPEMLSFSDQIGLFAAADIVVGVGGAGMFNALFCRKETALLSLESSEQWLESHANLFASRGLNYSIFLGEKVDKASGDPHGNWFINTSVLLLAVDELERCRS